jgi:hypothetical protein
MSPTRIRYLSSATAAAALFILTGATMAFHTPSHGLLRPHSPPFAALQLQMSLVPLPVEDLTRLVSTRVPTAAQYASYWGRTQRERYALFLESAVVSFVGVNFSYFLSFVIGGFVATIMGSAFCFWGVLSPELKAYQRNYEFLGGRDLIDMDDQGDREGLYGAMFLGRIDDVCVVQDDKDTIEFDLNEFQDYKMDADELEQYTGRPYLLRARCTDRTGRNLQVHARLTEDYLDLRAGVPVAAVLLSTSPQFTTLAALTDLYVPSAGCWIGDYPYLDRAETETLLAEDDAIWEALESERTTLSTEL